MGFPAVAALLVFAATVGSVIFLVLRPQHLQIQLRGTNFHIPLHHCWVPLLGVAGMLICQSLDIKDVAKGLGGDEHVQPYGILILFMSLAYIAASLDSTGVFAWAALHITHASKGRGHMLFFLYYGTSAVMTALTSNDVSVMTLTPIIIYFSRATKCDPMPYLIAEFVAANMWSMLLFVGNPTNIIVANAYNLTFASYTQWMALPTLAAGCVSMLQLYYSVRRQLPLQLDLPNTAPSSMLTDRVGACVGVINMTACLLLLGFAPSLHWDMWLITLVCALVHASYNVVAAVWLDPMTGRWVGLTTLLGRREEPALERQRSLPPYNASSPDEREADAILSQEYGPSAFLKPAKPALRPSLFAFLASMGGAAKGQVARGGGGLGRRSMPGGTGIVAGSGAVGSMSPAACASPTSPRWQFSGGSLSQKSSGSAFPSFITSRLLSAVSKGPTPDALNTQLSGTQERPPAPSEPRRSISGGLEFNRNSVVRAERSAVLGSLPSVPRSVSWGHDLMAVVGEEMSALQPSAAVGLQPMCEDRTEPTTTANASAAPQTTGGQEGTSTGTNGLPYARQMHPASQPVPGESAKGAGVAGLKRSGSEQTLAKVTMTRGIDVPQAKDTVRASIGRVGTPGVQAPNSCLSDEDEQWHVASGPSALLLATNSSLEDVRLAWRRHQQQQHHHREPQSDSNASASGSSRKARGKTRGTQGALRTPVATTPAAVGTPRDASVTSVGLVGVRNVWPGSTTPPGQNHDRCNMTGMDARPTDTQPLRAPVSAPAPKVGLEPGCSQSSQDHQQRQGEPEAVALTIAPSPIAKFKPWAHWGAPAGMPLQNQLEHESERVTLLSGTLRHSSEPNGTATRHCNADRAVDMEPSLQDGKSQGPGEAGSLHVDGDGDSGMDELEPPARGFMRTLTSLPWEVVPFVLGMFVLVEGLRVQGWVEALAHGLGTLCGMGWLGGALLLMGPLSVGLCNVINNQPMAILLTTVCLQPQFLEAVNSALGVVVVEGASDGDGQGRARAVQQAALFAVVVGSNVGALFTLIGALAGIMWSNIMREMKVHITYMEFVRAMLPLGLSSMLVSLLVLWAEVTVWSS